MTDEQLTAVQREAVGAPGPLRVLGGFGTGKTTALKARADRIAAETGDRVLVITRSRTTAHLLHSEAAPGVEVTTFVDHAMAILTTNRGPIRLVERPEQQAIVEGLLTVEGRDEWPTLCEHLHHVSFAEEVAATVLKYQASLVEVEDLRKHAAAADASDEWEELHHFTERYLDALDERRAVDTAGALVHASLLLHDEKALAAEQALYAAILVDDYELATIGTSRLLEQLAREGRDVTVTGNFDAAIQAVHGASPEHLARFRAANDVTLSERLRPQPSPWLVTGERIDEPAAIAEKIELAREERFSWSDMAVLARSELDARSLASRLPRGFTVATIDSAAGLTWPVVIIAGCTEGSLPAHYPHHRWFDPFVLSGTSAPTRQERESAWLAEEERRYRLAISRASSRLVLIAPPPASRFVTA